MNTDKFIGCETKIRRGQVEIVYQNKSALLKTCAVALLEGDPVAGWDHRVGDRRYRLTECCGLGIRMDCLADGISYVGSAVFSEADLVLMFSGGGRERLSTTGQRRLGELIVRMVDHANELITIVTGEPPQIAP